MTTGHPKEAGLVVNLIDWFLTRLWRRFITDFMKTHNKINNDGINQEINVYILDFVKIRLIL